MRHIACQSVSLFYFIINHRYFQSFIVYKLSSSVGSLEPIPASVNDATDDGVYSFISFSYYLELLSSVHLSGPELWRVDE